MIGKFGLRQVSTSQPYYPALLAGPARRPCLLTLLNSPGKEGLGVNVCFITLGAEDSHFGKNFVHGFYHASVRGRPSTGTPEQSPRHLRMIWKSVRFNMMALYLSLATNPSLGLLQLMSRQVTGQGTAPAEITPPGRCWKRRACTAVYQLQVLTSTELPLHQNFAAKDMDTSRAPLKVFDVI